MLSVQCRLYTSVALNSHSIWQPYFTPLLAPSPVPLAAKHLFQTLRCAACNPSSSFPKTRKIRDPSRHTRYTLKLPYDLNVTIICVHVCFLTSIPHSDCHWVTFVTTVFDCWLFLGGGSSSLFVCKMPRVFIESYYIGM